MADTIFLSNSDVDIIWRAFPPTDRFGDAIGSAVSDAIAAAHRDTYCLCGYDATPDCYPCHDSNDCPYCPA